MMALLKLGAPAAIGVLAGIAVVIWVDELTQAGTIFVVTVGGLIGIALGGIITYFTRGSGNG